MLVGQTTRRKLPVYNTPPASVAMAPESILVKPAGTSRPSHPPIQIEFIAKPPAASGCRALLGRGGGRQKRSRVSWEPEIMADSDHLSATIRGTRLPSKGPLGQGLPQLHTDRIAISWDNNRDPGGAWVSNKMIYPCRLLSALSTGARVHCHA